MWGLHVRRRVLRGLLLHRWWRDELLLRRSGASLPCTRHTERITDAWLALRRGTGTGCLQLLWLLGRSLLILDWCGWWWLHWWCLRLLYWLPSLGHVLVLLMLLAIRIRHRVYRDVSMRVKRNTDAVRCGSAILSLVAGVDTATACRPGRSGRDASGRGATAGWTTGMTIGTNASVSFSANRAFQMTAMAMGRRSC